MRGPHAHPRAIGQPRWALGGLCVLASGSGGNCAVVVIADPEPGPAPRRVVLVDAGLSPRRTARLLAERGIHAWEVDDILLTHLDADHLHAGWARALGRRGWRATIRVHDHHLPRARRAGLPDDRLRSFDAPFVLGARCRVDPVVCDHDELGVAAFRFEIASPRDGARCELGYATDVGRVRSELVAHLEGVGVLAIESNYCTRLQLQSSRPQSLKRRIMGGSGHLSNDQCLDAIARIRPRHHVVLLHLSQECNDPALVRALHADARYDSTVSGQTHATGWVWFPGEFRRSERPPVRTVTQPSLFAQT